MGWWQPSVTTTESPLPPYWLKTGCKHKQSCPAVLCGVPVLSVCLRTCGRHELDAKYVGRVPCAVAHDGPVALQVPQADVQVIRAGCKQRTCNRRQMQRWCHCFRAGGCAVQTTAVNKNVYSPDSLNCTVFTQPLCPIKRLSRASRGTSWFAAGTLRNGSCLSRLARNPVMPSMHTDSTYHAGLIMQDWTAWDQAVIQCSILIINVFLSHVRAASFLPLPFCTCSKHVCFVLEHNPVRD